MLPAGRLKLLEEVPEALGIKAHIFAPGEQATLPLLAAFRQGAEGGHLVGACVPGPSPLLPVLLRAGFRIRDRDTFMASEPGLIDAATELPSNGVP